MDEPAEHFRVRPNSGRGYFEVLIFQNLPALKRYAYWLIRKEKRDYDPGRFDAMFLSYSPGPLLGRVIFSRTRLSHGTVAHELNHAAIHWAHIRKLRPMADPDGRDSTHEELFAHAHSRMVDQFYKKLPIDK